MKSGKYEKLNGLDKLQKILDKQAGQPLVFFGYSLLLLG